MGQSVFQQPNGKYGIFSSVVDCPILWDATKEEIFEYFIERYRKSLERDWEYEIAPNVGKKWQELVEFSKWAAGTTGEMLAEEWAAFFEDVNREGDLGE